jgi:hypothetical protein
MENVALKTKTSGSEKRRCILASWYTIFSLDICTQTQSAVKLSRAVPGLTSPISCSAIITRYVSASQGPSSDTTTQELLIFIF